MKQKHVEFPHRTRQEWLQLAEKYFEAETSDEEERQLKLFLCSAKAQDPAFDELKAVMGYLAVGKSRLGRSVMSPKPKATESTPTAIVRPGCRKQRASSHS